MPRGAAAAAPHKLNAPLTQTKQSIGKHNTFWQTNTALEISQHLGLIKELGVLASH